MREIRISEMIRKLRGERGISQEMLATVCDVSMQAVSKWETGQSCPDITFLPLLAEYFDVSVDYLLTGSSHEQESPDSPLASQLEQADKEDVLYIIQYRNGKVLDKKQWDKERSENKSDAIQIQFAEEFQDRKTELHIEVWGDANIQTSDTKMNVSAGGNGNCGTVQGSVSANANVNCSTVEGNVSAGADVNCANIEGDASAGCSISCETVGGSAKAGMSINYKNN